MSSSFNNPPLEVGSIVREYEIQSVCSESETYRTYQAKHPRVVNKQVAIVVLHNPLTALPKDRFENLAREIGTVRDPGVAELYDFGTLESGLPYLIFEWAKGEKLDAHNTRSFSQEKIRTLLKSITLGLGAIHRAGVLFGNLSPSHVILNAEKGTAKLVGHSLYTFSQSVDPSICRSSDIHRLGQVLKLVCGEAGEDGRSLRGADDLEQIIHRCMSSAQDQYESADEVFNAICRALDYEGEGDQELPRGTLIGGTYRIIGLIGEGGMGRVYEAEHVRLPKRVAIKTISGVFTDESLVRFKREAEISSSLGHPHIVRVFDFDELPSGTPYMVMEFLVGEELSAAIKRGAFSVSRALRVTSQVGSGLTAAHNKDIVHRDLKPQNIFLSKVEIDGALSEHATILDFGVSKREGVESTVTVTQAVIGTPRYMAPEQAIGHNDKVTALSDQFALGSLVYEMLSGIPAFGAGQAIEIVHRVYYEEPPALESLVPGISPLIVAAISRAMSKKPESRFPSISDFISKLHGRFPSEDTEPNTEWLDGDATVNIGAVAVTPAGKGQVSATDTVATVTGRSITTPESSSAGAIVVSEPAVSDSAVSEPAVSDSAVSEPAVSEPSSAGATVVSEPAVSEPAVSEPAVSDSAVSDSAVSDSSSAGVTVASLAVASTFGATSGSSAVSVSGSSLESVVDRDTVSVSGSSLESVVGRGTASEPGKNSSLVGSSEPSAVSPEDISKKTSESPSSAKSGWGYWALGMGAITSVGIVWMATRSFSVKETAPVELRAASITQKGIVHVDAGQVVSPQVAIGVANSGISSNAADAGVASITKPVGSRPGSQKDSDSSSTTSKIPGSHKDSDSGSSATSKIPGSPQNSDSSTTSETNKTLTKARALLSKGKYGDARRLVTRDREIAKNSKARAIVVMSYCGQANFGAAKDWMARLSRKDRKSVLRYCKTKHDIDLH